MPLNFSERLPYLAYTLALDPAGSGGHRTLAKLLTSSLLRTGFAGEIWIFKNSEQPIYLTPREGVREIKVDVPNM